MYTVPDYCVRYRRPALYDFGFVKNGNFMQYK